MERKEKWPLNTIICILFVLHTVCHICFCHHILSLGNLHVTFKKRVSSHALSDVLRCKRIRQTALSVGNSHMLH